MKTKEEILENEFKKRGIRKGWIDESKQAVLDAMEKYAEEKLRLYHISNNVCQTFVPNTSSTTATKCKLCGREKWEH